MTEDKQALKPLSKKHEKVLNEYLICFVQWKAYQAGYPDASEESARTASSRLFANDNFRAHLNARLSEVHMTADEAIKRMTDMARGDLGDFLEITTMGHHIDLAKAQELGKTYLLKKVKQKTITVNGKDQDSETFIEEIELHDPQAALRDILKMHGKFKNEGIALPDNSTINIQIVRASDRNNSK